MTPPPTDPYPEPSPAAQLPQATLSTIVEHTPLVSIDLICHNPAGEVLLGWRRNRPARDSWFVPGGRIRKDERVAQALQRIAAAELGLDPASLPAVEFLRAWEHLYDDNFAGVEGVGTHYVVLGYSLALDRVPEALPHTQHRDYLWLTPDAMRARNDIHPNTLAYFPAR